MAVEKTPLLGLTKWTDPGYQDPVHVDQFNDDADALEAFAEKVEDSLYSRPQDFGAAGDGVYDGALWTGTNDTAALVAWLAAAEPGAKLRLPAGNYLCDLDQLSLDKPLTIVGDGSRHSRIIARSGSGTLVTVEPGLVTESNHVYNVNLEGVFFDGNGRSLDAAGVVVNLLDRSTWKDIRIAHFRRQGLWLQNSVRECRFDVYVRSCGSQAAGATAAETLRGGYPSIDLNHQGPHEGHNNIWFTGLCQYGYHDLFSIVPDAVGTAPVRGIFIDMMLHNFASPGAGDRGADGYTYAEDPTCMGTAILAVSHARNVYINGGRVHASGYGHPLVRIMEHPDLGAATVSSVRTSGVAFGWPASPGSALAVTAADPAANTLTSAAHSLSRGARVQVASTGAVPAPLAAGVDYFAVRVDDDTLALAATWEGAIAGTTLDLTGAGSGTITLNVQDHAGYISRGTLRVGGGTSWEQAPTRALVIGSASAAFSLDPSTGLPSGSYALTEGFQVDALKYGEVATDVLHLRANNTAAVTSLDTAGVRRQILRVNAANQVVVGDPNAVSTMMALLRSTRRASMQAGPTVLVDAVHDAGVDKLGFFGKSSVARPSLPAAGTVTAADIRAALIALGLCT